MKNYNKAGQKPGVVGKTYAQILEDEEERRRRERQQSTLPRLTNLSDLYKPAAAVSGAKSANTGSAASKAKAPQGKSANTFYTNTPNSGTIVPRFNNISAYNKAIEEGNKTLDDLAHRQFRAMLKNDVSAMNALEKQYKDTERYIGSLKAELGEVMGAGIHGPKGNQLTGSGWFGRMMDELSADGGKVHVTQLNDDPEPSPPPLPGPPPSEDLEDYYNQLDSLYGQHSAWEERMYNKLEKQYAPEKQRRIETLTYKPTTEFVSFITKGMQSAVSNLSKALSTGDLGTH
mgnify:FL=1